MDGSMHQSKRLGDYTMTTPTDTLIARCQRFQSAIDNRASDILDVTLARDCAAEIDRLKKQNEYWTREYLGLETVVQKHKAEALAAIAALKAENADLDKLNTELLDETQRLMGEIGHD